MNPYGTTTRTINSTSTSTIYVAQTTDSFCKTCETGKEPTGDQKSCVPVGEQAGLYSERTSGTCTESGGSYIASQAECENGASVFGYTTTANIFYFFTYQ